jgi:hypothetical protein
MARTINVIVETGRDLFSCFMVGADDLTGLHGDGKTARKAIEDFHLCYEEEKQYCRENGEEYPELEFNFIFDIGAFFSYYFINVTAFAEYAGMNASLLRQYACGLKAPTKKTIEKVAVALHQFKTDIDAGILIDRPVLQYV